MSLSSSSPSDTSPFRANHLPSTFMEHLVSASTQGVIITEAGIDRRIVYANTAFERMSGYRSAEIIGRTKSTLLSVPGDPSAWEQLEAAIEEMRPHRSILPIKRQNGTNLHAEIDIFPILSDNRTVTHWVTTLSDASERIQLEEALAHSEAQHRLLAETIRDLVMVHRPVSGICLYASPSSLRVIGFAPRELLSGSIYELIHPENLAHARKVFAGHGEGRPESTFIHRIRRKEGSYLWVETVSTSRLDAKGETEIVSTTRDISRRKEAEATLTAMHGLLSSVYEAVPVGLCLLDSRSYVQLCNRAFSSLFASDPAELAGRPVSGSIPLTEIAFAAGRAGVIHSFEAYRRNGSSFPAELTVTPVKFTDETWRLLTLGDLSERRRIEARLREARQLESLGTLAAGIAHDFNNLLTIILGYAGLLQGSTEDPGTIDRAATAIIDAGRRGADVVKQLQLFASQHEPEFARTDLQTLIEDTIESTCADWPDTIQVSCMFGIANPVILIDPSQVALGVRHLLQNACDAMPHGGTVTVRTSETLTPSTHGGESIASLMVTIEDSGQGMDAVTRSRIFEPFFAKDKGPAVRGLGLAVVYGIMRAHRGQIEVDSAPGAGTRVHLSFPRTSSVEMLTSLPGSEPTSAPAKSAHNLVLVVEDEVDIARLWENIFEAERIPMLWARDGEEALRLFSAHREEIGLLFTDIGLPGIDGWQVAQRIRVEVPNLPLLLVSGAFKPGDRAQSDLGPPVICLPKPFPPAEVLSKVRALLPNCG